MEHFESTGLLMQRLKDGKYKRLVMENTGSTLKSNEDFEAIFENYKTDTSRADNYEYFTRRQIESQDA
ncbi:MAG: hypothetical protein LBH43_16775 [Treponema sp.]|jgi:hypothetical protein|nr:hypothetical protein [Treponema sp.]